MSALKQRKVRCYYTDTTREKPNKTMVRYFIHSADSGGFWANIRDLSQAERQSNDAVAHKAALRITIGYNERVLEMWDRLTVMDERGRTYRIADKPDEYDYSRGDIKFTALLYVDNNVYGGDAYDY